jgi:ATP-dependent Clp protease ATP-binding subunit ClpA
MPNAARLQNLWIIAGILIAVVTVAKNIHWFASDTGLMCILGFCSLFGYFRWRLLKRQQTPETKGNIKKIKASDLQRIRKGIDENLIGQSESIISLLKILKRNLGMVNSNRHLGSYLLVGPTGTGKTYFAQQLAQGLYGHDSLINLAMNQQGLRGEYVIEMLLNALKKDPYRVVLLDEIDKASQEVYSSLYQFMESGKIMDQHTGEWFHCPGLVIIATTNAGSESDLSCETNKNNYALMEHIAANSSMPKAFLSRFDGISWFGQLSAVDVVQIAIMQVMSYYRSNGVNVNYLCPEAIIEIMKENQRFKSFGVRQLIQIVRHKSDSVIALAKSNGWEEVNIISDQKGNFTPQGIKKKRMAA